MAVSRLVSAALLLTSGALVGACGFSGLGTGTTEDSNPTNPAPTSTTDPSKGPPPAPTSTGTGSSGSSGGPAPVAPPCSDNVLSFDGVDDVASVPDDPRLDLSSDFTVEAWIKPSAKAAGATGAEMHLVSHHDWPASRGWVLLLDKGHAEIHVYGDESFASKGYAAGNTPGPDYIVAGKWAHVAGTLRGSTLRIYYDGVLRDTQEISVLFARANFLGRLTFGRASYTPEFRYEGQLDDVRLSSNARYTGATAPKPAARFSTDASTLALWHFDELSGTTLVDAQAKHTGAFLSDSTAPARAAAACIDAR